jgi:hypothetical protein
MLCIPAFLGIMQACACLTDIHFPRSSAVHCKEPMPQIRNKYSQQEELRGHSSNFHIHVSVSDLYIPTIGLPILLQENMWTDPGNI